MRLHGIPHSTNVHRVSLALGLKGRTAERIDHPVADRAALHALSGQELVPVLETGDGAVLTDSMPIVAWIDRTWPDVGPRLYPPGNTEIPAFAEFFNFVWKVAPNAIDAEQQTTSPDARKIAALGRQLRGWQHGFEALLTDRPFLMSADAPTAADVCAYPFLRFTTSNDPNDDDLFHGVLLQHLPGDFPNLAAWIARMAAFPVA
jgi:glutathione S-transferase